MEVGHVVGFGFGFRVGLVGDAAVLLLEGLDKDEGGKGGWKVE